MTLYQYIAKGVTNRAFESLRRYDEIISYNKNSAPTTLVRYGKTNTNSYSVIDNLEYNYYGNQLVQLDERNTRTLLYKGSFELAKKGSASVEYEYDANGNLTKDINKSISEITYDACNQPRTIKFDGGKSINYVYSVDGRKLSVAYISPLENLSNASANAFTATFDAVTAVEEPKLVSGTGTFSTVSAAHNGDTSSSISDIQASANKTNLSSIDKIAFVAPELGKAIGGKINLVSNISVTEYVGNFIFENGKLTKILMDDGYMEIPSKSDVFLWNNSSSTDGEPVFHYFIKDHLGSNRVVISESGSVEQTNHYYPYGGLIGDISTNPEAQKYKYNGKEYETMHGLNTYDYGARQYDPARITWDRMDQFCEKYYHINPYVYCAGNPINRIDPDGRIVRICSTDKNQILKYINSLASGTFKVDKDGYLYQASKQTDGKHSNLYSERLFDEINSAKVHNIVIDDKLTVVEGKPDVKKFGEGATVPLDKNEENFLTVISGKSHIVKDENGNEMNQTPAEILMHEIVGHSAPNMAPSKHDTGNAIEDENKVREELKLKKRKEDEDHVE